MRVKPARIAALTFIHEILLWWIRSQGVAWWPSSWIGPDGFDRSPFCDARNRPFFGSTTSWPRLESHVHQTIDHSRPGPSRSSMTRRKPRTASGVCSEVEGMVRDSVRGIGSMLGIQRSPLSPMRDQTIDYIDKRVALNHTSIKTPRVWAGASSRDESSSIRSSGAIRISDSNRWRSHRDCQLDRHLRNIRSIAGTNATRSFPTGDGTRKPKEFLGIYLATSVPRKASTTFDAGRSSDFRTGVSSLLIDPAGLQPNQQWQ